MSNPQDTSDKCTKQLRDWLKNARSSDQIELIVRLKAPWALEQPAFPRPSVEWEQYRAEKTMTNFIQFLHNLENEEAKAKLLDTSWLTHSVLLVANPPVINTLLQQDDVDLIDVNAQMSLRQ